MRGMTPRRVGVIFGGRSGEHEVSLASAASVIAALQRQGHTVVPIGIARDGRWVVGGDPMRALSDEARGALISGDATGGVKKALADRAESQSVGPWTSGAAQRGDPRIPPSAVARTEPPGGLPAELRTQMDAAVIMLHGPF